MDIHVLSMLTMKRIIYDTNALKSIEYPDGTKYEYLYNSDIPPFAIEYVQVKDSQNTILDELHFYSC